MKVPVILPKQIYNFYSHGSKNLEDLVEVVVTPNCWELVFTTPDGNDVMDTWMWKQNPSVEHRQQYPRAWVLTDSDLPVDSTEESTEPASV